MCSLKSLKQQRLQQQNNRTKTLELNDEEGDEMNFTNESAVAAWKEYRHETKHTKAFFDEQKERAMHFVNAMQKRVELLQSKMSSLKALSTKANNMKSVTSLGTLSNSTGPGSPLTDLPQTNYAKIPGERTVEEILLEDAPYSCMVRSSQLSPFMNKFAAKLFTSHDVAISSRLPDKQYSKRSAKLFQARALLQRTATAGCIANGNMGGGPQYEGEGTLYRAEDSVEHWIRGLMPNQIARQEVEVWRKEQRKQAEQRAKTTMNDQRKQTMTLSAMHFNPDEKLEEKTTFNAVFASDIRSALDRMTRKQTDLAQTLKDEEWARTLASKFTVRGSTGKLLAKQRKLRSAAPGPGEYTARQKADAAAAGMTPAGEPLVQRGKLRLMNIIKKIGARYVDKNEIEDRIRKKQERERIEGFMHKIKAENCRVKGKLGGVLARTNKMIYKKI